MNDYQNTKLAEEKENDCQADSIDLKYRFD